jgi:hypothetical protein
MSYYFIEVTASTLALARVIATVTGSVLPVIVLRTMNEFEFDIFCPRIVASASTHTCQST